MNSKSKLNKLLQLSLMDSAEVSLSQSTRRVNGAAEPGRYAYSKRVRLLASLTFLAVQQPVFAERFFGDAVYIESEELEALCGDGSEIFCPYAHLYEFSGVSVESKEQLDAIVVGYSGNTITTASNWLVELEPLEQRLERGDSIVEYRIVSLEVTTEVLCTDNAVVSESFVSDVQIAGVEENCFSATEIFDELSE